jgi:hypothetical protein
MVFQTSSIIFLDGPVGAGFSYANTTEAWNTTDTLWAAQSYEFIRNVSVFDDKKKWYIYTASFLSLIGLFETVTITLNTTIINNNKINR